MSTEMKNVEPIIRVNLVGKHSAKFVGMLDDSGVEYVSGNRFPPGTPVANAETVAIAVASISALGAIISAWINSRKSRSASITHINNSITQINVTMSPEQISTLLETARTTMIIDTKPTDEEKA